jgi:acyl carrier protein
MTDTALHAKLEEIVRDVVGDDDIALTDTTTASDVPGWDSLAHVNIMFAVEQEFDIQFSDDDMAAAVDVGQLKHRIREKVAA